MPTVRMLQSVAGLDFSWVPGDEVEMADEQAAGWADGIRGELVAAKEAVEPRPEAPERSAPQPETPERGTEQPARRGPGRPRKS